MCDIKIKGIVTGEMDGDSENCVAIIEAELKLVCAKYKLDLHFRDCHSYERDYEDFLEGD